MDDDMENRAFGFSGTWQEYAPIAFTNLLLTIVTLGIYRFWATTRTRQYLWSRTRFIDAQLEWTGKGKELFIGFLLVMLLLFVPLFIIQFGAQALVLQGYGGLAACLTLLAFLFLMYLGGLARYRALRYRLSRTYWHGIRGGSDDAGLSYGWSYMWKTAVGSLVLGLMVPWAMMSLWNERWNRLSFGPHAFEAAGNYNKIFKRYLLFYLLPILMIVVGGIGAVFMAGASSAAVAAGADSGGASIVFAGVVALVVIGFYVALGIVALAYYSAFFREAIEGLSLSTLNFHFEARTKEWFMLILGDIGLVIVTLGIGSIFLNYRHWKFFITHMQATGVIDLEALTQTTVREPKQGEGLLDAFDIGAI